MSLIRRLSRARDQAEWFIRRSRSGAPRSFEEQVLAAVVTPGDVCLDIGANIGDISVFMAMHAGPMGEVHAFEPVPPTYRSLCMTTQQDRSIRAPIVTYPFGLAEEAAEVTISVPRSVFSQASMAAPDAWRAAQRGAELQSFGCLVRKLDDVRSANDLLPPNVIKIDVEGAELGVLRGAAETLRHTPVILAEIFAPWEAAFGYTPFEPLDLLTQAGYSFLFMCPDGLVAHGPTRAQPFPPGFEHGYNVLAHHPGKHASRIGPLQSLHRGAGAAPLAMARPPMPNAMAARVP